MTDGFEDVTEFIETAYPFTNQPADCDEWIVVRELSLVPKGKEWYDLREHQTRPFYAKRLPDDKQRKLDEISGHYAETITRRFRRQYPWLLDDMHYDLVSVVEARVTGEPSAFFEELFRVYRSGGFPCGWHGEYPAGKLIVLLPNRESL